MTDPLSVFDMILDSSDEEVQFRFFELNLLNHDLGFGGVVGNGAVGERRWSSGWHVSS